MKTQPSVLCSKKCIQPVKATASKPLGMVVNVSGWVQLLVPCGQSTCLLQKEMCGECQPCPWEHSG